ncbi:MAG: chemotaxis protein CheW [Candidatus Thiodiazotropha sp. (ex. Lucinisca nassula)]|nr:chemotaxis protein CheW [Candidatus Thiodiazotropha sp. (ex. Lucinisca nassula)]MBW9260567.1 chemotaxis protein CheW [Candidatus Thiodiazotropha sp. (ex. Lucinisca nassula)]MBW9270228.1 chemotaxis protein CheW [Candidatus Thiodiazotropha sp. (ex. Lucinisca nassula)]
MSLGNDKSRTNPVSEKVEEPDHALKSYLDTLLLEIETLPSESVVVKEPPPVADIKVEESQISEPKLEQSTQTQQQSDSALPDWVESEFQVLLFKVNGITMGIPLNAMKGILNYSGEASQLPGQPAWSLGVIINRDEKVVVIDSARLLMPERLTADTRSEPQQLLLIGEGDRALAVDTICNTMIVAKEDVRWRNGIHNKPWYAGIIVEELSVLLDVDGVLQLLAA